MVTFSENRETVIAPAFKSGIDRVSGCQEGAQAVHFEALFERSGDIEAACSGIVNGADIP